MVDLKVRCSLGVHKFLDSEWFETATVREGYMFEGENRVEKKLTKWSKLLTITGSAATTPGLGNIKFSGSCLWGICSGL